MLFQKANPEVILVSINAISLAAEQLDIRVGNVNNATCGVVITFKKKSFVD